MDGLLRSIASKDWKGALGGVLDILGGQGGKLGGWAKIGGDILKMLPGFKTGGSFKVGGSGGVDSSLVAFRATPGEMVDVRRPGQGLSGGSSPYFDLRGAVMTQDLLDQMNHIGRTSETRANSWSTRHVPGLSQSQTAKQQQYTVGRKKR